MAYRIERNIEASFIDAIEYGLAHATTPWTGINVVKGFPKNYKGKLPLIGVEVLELNPVKKEIGSKDVIKYFQVRIRFFAVDDGQRLDVSSWLFDYLLDDVNYYTYTITDDVAAKVLAGRIIITDWIDNKKEFINTEALAQEDRYRHIFSFSCYVAS